MLSDHVDASLSPRRGAFVPPHTDDSPLILTTDQRGEGGRGRAWQAQGSERRPHSHGCAHARSARQSRVVFRTLPSSNFVMPNRSVRLFSPGSPLETSQASRSATPSCFRTTAGRKWISGISARRKARRRSCTATRRSWASSSRAERKRDGRSSRRGPRRLRDAARDRDTTRDAH